MLRIWRERRLCSNLDQLYLWTYWISQRLNPSYFGFLIALAGLPSPWKIAVARQPLERKFSAGAGLCLATVFFQVTMVSVEAGGLPSQSSAHFLLQRFSQRLAPRVGWRRGLPTAPRARLRRPARLPQRPGPRHARGFGTLLKRTVSWRIVEQFFREQQRRYHGGIALPVLNREADLCVRASPRCGRSCLHCAADFVLTGRGSCPSLRRAQVVRKKEGSIAIRRKVIPAGHVRSCRRGTEKFPCCPRGIGDSGRP